MEKHRITYINTDDEEFPVINFTEDEMQILIPVTCGSNTNIAQYSINLKELADHLKPFINNKDEFTELE